MASNERSSIVSAEQPQEPYTGETIVMPRRRREAPNRPPAPRPPATAPRARRSAWWWARRVALWLFVAALVGVGLLYWQVRSVAGVIVVDDVRPNAPLAAPLFGANVLVMGVDERPGHPEEGVRSDTLILAHLGGAGGWASLLSIPRDTQVETPNIGVTKINAAYYDGYLNPGDYGDASPRQAGMARAAEVVEQALGLREIGQRVDYTAQINFDGFAAIIDALGGITVNVPTLIVDEEYPTPDFGITRVEFQPGPQRMDGQRALIYARTRHQDSDFGRAQRQQQVLRAIMEEFRARGLVGRVASVPGLLRALEGSVSTTMPIANPDALLALLLAAGRTDPNEIVQLRLGPETVAFQEGPGGNLIWDATELRALVERLFTRPSLASENATVQVLNGTGRAGLGRRVSGELENAGYRVIVAADAPPQPDGTPYPRTVVYDAAGKPLTARRVASLFGAELQSGPPPNGAASSADVVVILGLDIE
jgi:LCP family protein required for cell wall assembly